MDESRTRLIILALGILLVAFVAMWFLGNIWSSNDESTSAVQNVSSDASSETVKEQLQTQTIGSYSNVTNGQDRIVKEYFADIFKVFTSGSKEDIYDITSKYYIEKYSLDADSLYSKLKKKGLLGKAFDCTNYVTIDNPRFGRLYSLEISSIDGRYNDKIILIEEKPRDFKVTFDSYIGKKNLEYEVINRGLKLRLNNVEEYRDVVYFSISLENVSDDVLVLNSKSNASEAIYLVLDGNTKIYDTYDYFNGNEKVLRPNEKITFKQEFFISDLQAGKIKDLGIVNVLNQTSKTEEDFIFNLYK